MSTDLKARYIMIGGFLGAGKTTAVSRLAEHLTRQGVRIGLITNDQGAELVDTALLRARGFATKEIPGGCFCCRFNSLLEAARLLNAQTRPEVFIAEPVGSCTDLVATVTYPLRRIYGDEFRIAPLSVLVDPTRAARVLGLEGGRRFSVKVTYIYRKQLEEADLIVINKSDVVEPARLDCLRKALETEFPLAKVLTISARTGAGLEAWFAQILQAEQVARETMAVDYATYAQGEALLGWLNATIDVQSAVPFDGALLKHLATALQQQLGPAEIAHLKMTLSPTEGLDEIAVVNLVRSDFVPELSQELPDRVTAAHLIVNLRAEAEPQRLQEALETVLRQPAPGEVQMKLAHLEFFKPGEPKPTHRDQVTAAKG